MTSSSSGVPHALLHNLKHNKVLHERVILLTVRIEDVPYVSERKGSKRRTMAPAFTACSCATASWKRSTSPRRSRSSS